MEPDFDTKWDIVSYKTPFEPEEHWDLKAEFMKEHKETFPEARLVCLAQVFANIELLGCRYPEKTMKQVSLLSKGMGHDYRNRKKTLLQRTFIQASDAAIDKVTKNKKPKYSR